MTPAELQQSLLSQRQDMQRMVASAQAPSFQLVSLAKVQTSSGLAQAWRITLGRVERQDGSSAAAPGDPGNSVPIYIAASYPYDAWLMLNPVLPPRRAQPIFSALTPDNGGDSDAMFVEIAWGQGDGSGSGRPHRLLAHWPVQGASIVVAGAYVEVWGAGRVTALGTPPIPFGSFPTFQASVVQDSSVHTESAAELSLTESISVRNALTDAFLFPDGVAHPGVQPGFGLALNNGAAAFLVPTGALRGSAVLDVAPFRGWNPILRPAIAGRTPRLSIQVQGTGFFPNVAVFNNSQIDSAGNVTPSNGDVAVQIDTTAAPQLTFALLEAAITAAAASNITVATPSPLGASFVTSAVNGAFANVAGYNPSTGSELGVGEVAPAVQGAVVYVPDFARRVKVVLSTLLVAPAGNGPRIPIGGDPACVLVFFDERGNVIDQAFQGVIASGNGIVAPDFRAVPAGAVLLGVYPSATDVNQYAAMIHWRIAP